VTRLLFINEHLIKLSTQVPISSSCPDHILSTFWMCLFATIQSAIFALIKEENLQVWTLNSPLQISCSLYAVSLWQVPQKHFNLNHLLQYCVILILF